MNQQHILTVDSWLRALSSEFQALGSKNSAISVSHYQFKIKSLFFTKGMEIKTCFKCDSLINT